MPKLKPLLVAGVAPNRPPAAGWEPSVEPKAGAGWLAGAPNRPPPAAGVAAPPGGAGLTLSWTVRTHAASSRRTQTPNGPVPLEEVN